MECLNNIIGISKSDCECFANEFSEEYKQSKSGLYLDENEAGLTLDRFRDLSACADLEETLAGSIKLAKSQLKEKLFMHLGEMYQSGVDHYSGNIGSRSFNEELNLPDGKFGFVIDMKGVKGGVLRIEGINSNFNNNEEIVLTIESAVKAGNIYAQRFILNEITLNTNEKTSVDITLPSIENGIAMSYIFTYEKTGALQPFHNKTGCGCASEKSVKKFLKVSGWDDNSNSTTKSMHGIYLIANISCYIENVFCDQFKTNEQIQLTTSHFIHRMALANAIRKILSSTNISRQTMVDRESLERWIYVMEGEANKSVLWTAQNLNVSGSECFICNENNAGQKFKLAGIIS